MPKKKIDEEDEVVVFSDSDLEMLDTYFKGTNAETAYMLGRYCGLRINECYGLTWDDIDLEQGTVSVNKQMQYQDGIIKLVVPKTKNAKRTVYISPKLKAYLTEVKQQREKDMVVLKAQRQQNQIYIEDINHRMIPSTDLLNCLSNGKIQTNNSMKYHSKTLKNKYDIIFKYHYLRHTYGSTLASLNTPAHILCNQMGHASSKVTEKYYLAVNKIGIEILQENLCKM